MVQEVNICLKELKHRILKPARVGDPIPAQISNNWKFSPYFDNCIGAIDGTHIPAIILCIYRVLPVIGTNLYTKMCEA